MHPEVEPFARLLRFDAWANADAVGSLAGAAPPQAVRWMAHIVGAEVLWLRRLTSEPSELEVWPDLDQAACAAKVEELSDAWPRYLSTLSSEDLRDSIAYRNTKGEFWTNAVADILTHVVTHSAYHRGQIAAAVSAAGGTPAYTDFIHGVRQGRFE
jgi:uncharacterized damage-inducible protein DinB